MTPTIGGPDGTDESDEPGGSTCYKCREDLEAGDYAYREVFGEIDHTTDHGVVFGTTGGVPTRHYCQACYRKHRKRDKAAHYRARDGDRFWQILEAADGELVADLRPMMIGKRGWIRVVDGELEGRVTERYQTDDGRLGFRTKPWDITVLDFADRFDEPGDRARVMLKPAEETPFRDDVDVDVTAPVAGDGAADEQLQEKEERIQRLEAQVTRLKEEGGPTIEPLKEYDEFLNADPVREQIEAAKEEAAASPRYVKGVLAGILNERGPVPYEVIAERLGVSTTTDVSKAASELERRKVVTKDHQDDGMYVDLNIDGMNEIREAAAEREKTEELMEGL